MARKPASLSDLIATAHRANNRRQRRLQARPAMGRKRRKFLLRIHRRPGTKERQSNNKKLRPRLRSNKLSSAITTNPIPHHDSQDTKVPARPVSSARRERRKEKDPDLKPHAGFRLPVWKKKIRCGPEPALSE